MFEWKEKSSIPEFTNEMIHYRNSMVKEIDFVFSDKYSKNSSDEKLQEKMEFLKDARGKTANKMKSDDARNKVWFDMFYDVFRTSSDFTAADLYLKYFNIPNDVIFPDFYYIMKDSKSKFQKLINSQNFSTAFGYLQFFPSADSLNEYTEMLKITLKAKNSEAIQYLIEHIELEPYNKLLNDGEIRSLLSDEFKRAEKEKKLDEAAIIAKVLKMKDFQKRIEILSAMLKNNHSEAIAGLKEITELGDFKEIVKEFYVPFLSDAITKRNSDLNKTAYEYALNSKFTSGKDVHLIEEPAGFLFQHYVGKNEAIEADYFEAEKYLKHAKKSLVQDVVSEQMLVLITQNQTKQARDLKKRFNVDFQSGSYPQEEKIRKFFKNLTETYGSLDIPKGEENLLTAIDIAKLFNFIDRELYEVRLLICKFYISNRFYEKAKKYFIPGDKGLNDMVVEQLQSFVNKRDYKTAYKFATLIPISITTKIYSQYRKEVSELAATEDLSPDVLARAMALDDLFSLGAVPASFYNQAFEYGLTSGQQGVQFLVDMQNVFENRMEACKKIKLEKHIKKLLGEDKVSADILARAYRGNIETDFIDFIIYLIKRFFGLC